MMYYFTPGTGKTTFCMTHTDITDGDVLLKRIFRQYFPIQMKRAGEFSKLLLMCFHVNYNLAEKCYSEYYLELMHYRVKDVYMGTMRFMEYADFVFIEDNAEVLKERGKTDDAELIVLRQRILIGHKGIIHQRMKGKFVSEMNLITV